MAGVLLNGHWPYFRAGNVFDFANIQLEKEHNEEYGQSSSDTGILLLCRAMAELAIDDIKKNKGASHALGWIMSNERDYFLSFLNVCNLLKMNPANIRRAVAAYLAGGATKGRSSSSASKY